MKIVSKIVEKLNKYPEVKYEIDEDTISIIPSNDDGFLVWFTETGHDLTVGFEGWHEHFNLEEEENALNLFSLGLSEDSRLLIFSRGNYDYKWSAEYINDENWEIMGTTSLIFFPFWKNKSQKYHQNKYIKTS